MPRRRGKKQSLGPGRIMQAAFNEWVGETHAPAKCLGIPVGEEGLVWGRLEAWG